MHEKNVVYIPSNDDLDTTKGVGELMLESMKKHSDIIAQIDPATEETLNFASFLSNSIRIAQNLKAKGIGVGDIIAVCSECNMDYPALYIGSIFNGTIIALIDPYAHSAYMNNCLNIASPKFVFCDEKLEKTMEELLEKSNISAKIVVFGKTEKHEPFSNFLIPQEPEDSFSVYKPDDINSLACLLFTSGTTGTSKGVNISYYLLLKIAMEVVKLREDYRFITFTPTPFWISNVNLLILSCLFGDTRIIVKSLHEETIMKHVEKYRINFIFISPSLGAKLLANPEYYKNYDISCLKILGSGGSPTHPKQVLEYIKALPHVKIIIGYGMTELGGIGLKSDFQEYEEVVLQDKPSMGSPMLNYKYKIVNPDTEETLGPNQEGELRIWHESIKNVYYNNEKANKESFDKDGYFKTGDIAFYNEKPCFFYVSRMKDVFKYYGYQVSPSDIEDELIKHPNVLECIVFGIPETTVDVELATAAVTLKDKTKFDEEEMIKFVNDRLAHQLHIRGGIYVFDKFPETTTGKILRKKVAEIVLNIRNTKKCSNGK